MSQKFPTDDFDLNTEIGGRHRARRGFRDRFIEFVQVIVVGVVISAGGYVGLQVIANNGNLGVDIALNSTSNTTNEFTKGNGVGVSVIDATDANDAASKLAQKLLDQGWNVFSASRLINSSGHETSRPVTIVYASSDASAKVAASLAKSLGNYEVRVSPKYEDPVTVVLGLDYNN
jgi:hypothetical protein